jgi:DNA polymerase II large subunit
LFWGSISNLREIELLRQWLTNCEVTLNESFASKIVGEASDAVIESLRKIFVQHKIFDGKIVLVGEDAASFGFSLGYGKTQAVQANSPLEMLSLLSSVQIKDKAPTYVGGRMGRPEKAKHREMKPLVHLLFPVGLKGGTHRDLMEASRQGPVFVELAKRKCPNCKSYTLKIKCPSCNCETISEKICPRCGKTVKDTGCSTCKTDGVMYQRQPVNFKELIAIASSNLGYPAPKMLRGVKGLTNLDKTPENIEKGILRAKHGLSVYKDGTIRFDATNAPLTHITPAEVGVSVEKMRQMDYLFRYPWVAPN